MIGYYLLTGVLFTGYADSVLLLQGDQKARINKIIEKTNYRDVKDIGNADDFDKANSYVFDDLKLDAGKDRDFLVVGVCNGWTVIRQIPPLFWDDEACLEVSGFIQGKVLNVSMETHVGYTHFQLCDRGLEVRNIDVNDTEINKNTGNRLPAETHEDISEFCEFDVYDLVKDISGIVLEDLMDGTASLSEKVSIKTAVDRILDTPDTKPGFMAKLTGLFGGRR